MAQSTKETDKVIPPYISGATFLNALNSISDHGVPQVIDRSVLGKFSGAVQRQLFQAFRFLKFTNGSDQRTELFENYAKSDANERKKLLEKVIYLCYPTQLSITPDGTMQQLQNSFSEFDLEPSVRAKCVSFFLQIAKHAGFVISSHIANRSRASSPRKASTKKTKPTEKGKLSDENQTRQRNPDMTSITIPLGPDKSWTVEMPKQHTAADLKKFIQVLQIVLSDNEQSTSAEKGKADDVDASSASEAAGSR